MRLTDLHKDQIRSNEVLNLSDLSVELLFNICQYLDDIDLYGLANVSQTFYEVCTSQYLRLLVEKRILITGIEGKSYFLSVNKNSTFLDFIILYMLKKNMYDYLMNTSFNFITFFRYRCGSKSVGYYSQAYDFQHRDGKVAMVQDFGDFDHVQEYIVLTGKTLTEEETEYMRNRTQILVKLRKLYS